MKSPRSLLLAIVLATLTVSMSTSAIHNESVLGKVQETSAEIANALDLSPKGSAADVRPMVRSSSDISHLSLTRRHRGLTKRCKGHHDASHEKSNHHKSKGSHKGKDSDAGSSKSSSNNDATNYTASSKSGKSNKGDDVNDNDSSSSSSSKSSSSKTSAKVSDVAGKGDYHRVQQNRGKGFWSGNWDFWSHADPTHGQVDYQSEQGAKSKNLIGMKDGAAFMRVSNEDTNGGNRPSVRFQSKKAYDSGLVIFDVVKMPVGCGTWPALWTTKGDNWPHGGEIDVLEGVGYTAGGQNANQMTVHLGQNSPLSLNRRAVDKRATYTGRLLQGASNCNQWGSHTGCAFFDQNKNGASWGEDFNKAGGGIWAMEFGNGNGVKIWFWGRKSGNIPDELSKPSESPKKLDPTSWGRPVANFQSSVIDRNIKAQNIIMDITVGGDWAGNVPLDGRCKGQSLWQAIKKGSNYNDAEFIINAIDIYCQNGKC